MANQSINLNLIPSGIAEVARVSQFDVGRIIEFNLYHGSDPYISASGLEIEVHGMKADKNIFIYTSSDGSGAVSISGSTITLKTTLQMTAASGETLLQFRLKRDGDDAGTLNCIMYVQEDPAAEGDISESELPAIISQATDQMERAEAAATSAGQSATAAAGSATSAWSSASSAQSSATQAAGSAASAARSATRAETAAQAAEAASGHPPYIGANGNWWVWNTTAGEYADSGIDASITVQIADITMLDPSASPYVTNSGTDTDPIFHLFIPRGKGIASVTKTGTSGLTDTYTITYTDGATTAFTVTNGRGIVSIQKTGTAGLVDTYTITYNDGSTSTFTVTNGQDGSGNVNSVNNIPPVQGNVTLGVAGLSDVDLTNLANGQVLVWNAEDQKWENADQTGGHTVQGEEGVSVEQANVLQFLQAKAKTQNGKTTITPDLITISDVEIEEGDPIPKLFYAFVSELPYEPPTWSEGTDAEIVEALQKHYQGVIDLREHWSVGDTREVTLAAMTATGVGEPHEIQTVELVIMAADTDVEAITNPLYNYPLSTAIGEIVRPVFIVGQKDGLCADSMSDPDEDGYMNATATNSGGWASSARRAWCNAVYKAAIPETLRGIIKQVKVTTANGGTADTVLDLTDDYVFLTAQKEVIGEQGKSAELEANALSIYPYYETEANRWSKYRYSQESNSSWWNRSPAYGASSGTSRSFCSVMYAGSTGSAATMHDANTVIMIKPHFCI